MRWTLFRATLRANWLLGVAFSLIVLIYVATAASMFSPTSSESIEAMFEFVPDGMLRAMGFENLGTNLTGYLGNYLYGLVMIIFPMIYGVITANRLIAKHVDSGSMAYLLTTPTTRVQVAVTGAVYLAVSMFFIFAVSAVGAVLIAESSFAGMLDIGRYLGLNLVAYLALLAAAAIGYLSSCSFSDSRYSLAFGSAIPIVFFVARMLSKLGDELEWLRYLSLYSFIDVTRLLSEPGYVLTSSVILLSVSLVVFAAGVIVFDRRSLAI